jgi:DNA repair protein RecN (Recombination protein N)
MLTELRIRNFAIIESLSLPLARGFNVLSGETGAGKSIIVGALGLLLGERASADLIRTGAEKASVEGVFDIGDRPDVAELLDKRGIDADELVVVLKREIVAGGRTRAWINGTPVSAGVLAEIGRHLVNLHGQHEAQTLLDAESQRQILDAFAGSSALAEELSEGHAAWGAIGREIAELERRRADAERRADYLRHVLKEIDDARLSDPDEDSRLEEEARRLEHAEELRSTAGTIVDALEGEEGVLHLLGSVERQLGSLQRIDPTLQRLQELYDGAFYNLEALARELNDYGRLVELDPERLEEVRRRRDLIFRMTRKYGPSIADIVETGRRTRAELDLVDSAEFDLRQLQAREREARAHLETLAGELTAKRTEAAARLGAAVDEQLPALGMPDGRFTVRLVPLPEITSGGAEAIEFCVALNIGHEARLLARVASGGELSRVTLALKTILARIDRVPTLVFDEVDAGIGGRVGLQVGETLRGVASYHQVFAITHLPQIAGRAHHHIVVSKGARGGVTAADVMVVAGEDRVTEVARMLGGDPESDTSRAHARELLETAAAVDAPLAATGPPAAGRRSKRR